MVCPADKPDTLFYQRAVYITSYVWNGAVCEYKGDIGGAGWGTFKISQFKPQAVLMWETDEKTPFYFNDASSFPDEGISGRHGKGATIALFSGGTERIRVAAWYNNNGEFAGASGQRGNQIPKQLLPNRAWCNPSKLYGTENF